MSAADMFGYEVTITPASAPALASWRETTMGFLAHAAVTPKALARTLELAPDFALAHATKGFFLLLLGRRELIATAREAHVAACARSAELTARERGYVEALGAYLAGRPSVAADRLDALLIAYPRDALAMKLVHAIRFVLGDARGMRASIERALPALEGDHPARGYAYGCLAFALEETGEYLRAERVGRDAVMLARDDAWGLHAVAHVFDMTNRSTEGVAWIRKQPDAWAHCNNFGYHVWWHLALFHLDRGETDEALRLYDERVRSDKTDDYRDIANAASLLARLEVEGVAVGARWDELAAFAAGRVDDGCVVFADLHYLLALGGAGREDAASRLLARLRVAGARAETCMDHVAADAGAPAAAGLCAFARGDYARAFEGLAAARPAMQSIGGSHAQRDVFERLTIEAALRSGRLAEARATLQSRTLKRGALDRYAETRLARIAELEAGGGSAVIAAE